TSPVVNRPQATVSGTEVAAEGGSVLTGLLRTFHPGSIPGQLVLLPVRLTQAGIGQGVIRVLLQSVGKYGDGVVEILRLGILKGAAAAQVIVEGGGRVGLACGQCLPVFPLQLKVEDF